MTDEAEKKEAEFIEKKELEFYKACISAWYASAFERDKSLLTLSAGGIGLLMTLVRTSGISSIESLMLHIGAIISFLICLICTLTTFEKNKSHIEQIVNDKNPDDSLKLLDKVAHWSFGIAIIFSTVIGISSAINSYTTRVTQMANEHNKQIESSYIIQDIKPIEIGTSVDGIVALKPNSATAKSVETTTAQPVTNNQDTKK
jgi:hypothetical protein